MANPKKAQEQAIVTQFVVEDGRSIRFTINIDGLTAVTLLATIQLALRHPTFKDAPTAHLMKTLAQMIQDRMTQQEPKLAFLLEAGWHERFDRNNE
jgi:hypothetical protein